VGCIPYRADGGSESAVGCMSEATAPGPCEFKTSDGLISVNEDLHLFKQSVFLAPSFNIFKWIFPILKLSQFVSNEVRLLLGLCHVKG
jgi:hypothetical protein